MLYNHKLSQSINYNDILLIDLFITLFLKVKELKII